MANRSSRDTALVALGVGIGIGGAVVLVFVCVFVVWYKRSKRRRRRLLVDDPVSTLGLKGGCFVFLFSWFLSDLMFFCLCVHMGVVREWSETGPD